MNLSKAIEILDDLALIGNVSLDNDDVDAITLGKEALTFLERWRSKAEIQVYPLLPSETKE